MTPDTNKERAILDTAISLLYAEADAVREGVTINGEPDWSNEPDAYAAFQQLSETAKALFDLAAKAPAAEPVAVVCDAFELRWIGDGPIAQLVKRHNIKVGSFLYTAPPATTEQWMPIETAPEDGSLLILTDGEKVFRGAFAKVEFKEHRDADGNYIDQTDPDAYCLNFDDRDVCHPTHWQPEPALPAPPQGAAKGGEHAKA